MANRKPHQSKQSNHPRWDHWGRRTRSVNTTREQLRKETGEYPTQRELCRLLKISPKILGRCIQKIEGRSPFIDKQGARKRRFDEKLFCGLSLIYLTGRRDGTLSAVAESNFHEYLLDMLMQSPEYRKVMRSCMPVILLPDDEK